MARNRTLEEIKDRKISNDHSPGGGQAGAVVITLQRLELYLGTQFFLVDLETGEMFAYIRQQWRRTGLYCSDKAICDQRFNTQGGGTRTGSVGRARS